MISAGELKLAQAGGVGSSTISFASTASAARLVIEAPDTPAPGATFASELLNFDSDQDSVDLAGVAFVQGAAAVAQGSTLVLTDGGHSYDFALGGRVAPSYVVTQDRTGTLITADPPAMGEAARLVETMAAFGAQAAPVGAAAGPGPSSAQFPCLGAPVLRAPR